MMEKEKQRRKLGFAVLISLLLHLAVGYSLAAFGSAVTPALPLEDAPSELTIMDLSETPPPAPKNLPYIETETSRESAEKPKDQTFESNANSKAASQLPATGDLPLPTQDGRERPAINLDTRDFSPQTQGAQPQPQAKETLQPDWNPPAATTASPKSQPSEPPKPSPAPAATVEPEQFAMLTATPPPPLKAPEEAETSPTPNIEGSAAPVVPRPKPESPASRFQSYKEQTRIAGNISNRGPSSVNTVGTPLGRYQKQMYDAAGARWYRHTEEKRDLITIGTVKLTFWVERSGRVTNIKVVENTSNEAFVSVCLQSVQELKLPPIPEDVASTLPSEGLSGELTFTLYAN